MSKKCFKLLITWNSSSFCVTLCICSEFHPYPLVAVAALKLTLLNLLCDSLFSALLTILNLFESTVCLDIWFYTLFSTNCPLLWLATLHLQSLGLGLFLVWNKIASLCSGSLFPLCYQRCYDIVITPSISNLK